MVFFNTLDVAQKKRVSLLVNTSLIYKGSFYIFINYSSYADNAIGKALLTNPYKITSSHTLYYLVINCL